MQNIQEIVAPGSQKAPREVPFEAHVCYFWFKKQVPVACWFACRLVFVFPCFSEESDPRSAAACAVITQFFTFGIAFTKLLFLLLLLETSKTENQRENVSEVDVENKC